MPKAIGIQMKVFIAFKTFASLLCVDEISKNSVEFIKYIIEVGYTNFLQIATKSKLNILRNAPNEKNKNAVES